MPVAHFESFVSFFEEFVAPARVRAASLRLDGLSTGLTRHRPIARVDHLGHTWNVDGDTHFEPLEIAYRSLIRSPASEPFRIGRTKTRLKLVLRDDLDGLRHDRGTRNATYLYAYAKVA